MSDLWSGLFALGGAVLGFAGATLTTARQLAHARQMDDIRLKRQTFKSFASAAVEWSDTALHFGHARVTQGDVAGAWERQTVAWRELNDAYALLLLVASNQTVQRVESAFPAARDDLVDLTESPHLDDESISAASLEVKRAVSSLINVFRAELREPLLRDDGSPG